jgi:chromate reductase
VDRNPFRILAVAGSLWQGPYNRGLLRAAQDLAPEWVEVRFFDIGQLPLFNEDIEVTGDPEPVRRFKDAIAASNAVLIATPGYNGAVPGCWPTQSTGRRDHLVAACYATN